MFKIEIEYEKHFRLGGCSRLIRLSPAIYQKIVFKFNSNAMLLVPLCLSPGPYATYIGLDFFDLLFKKSVSNPISSKAFSSPHRSSSDFGKEFLSLRTMIDSPGDLRMSKLCLFIR